MSDLNIEWLYTADTDAQYPHGQWLGRGIAGGRVWFDVPRLLGLWSGIELKPFRHTLEALISRSASRYWIVAHQEGVLYARELLKRGFSVHLTVQDDLPDGIMRRSTRYRLLAPIAQGAFYDALGRADSVDVTSDGMQNHYQQKLGLSTTVIHPVIWEMVEPTPSPPIVNEVLVGHLGNLYSREECVRFLRALGEFAERRGIHAKMLMIGLAEKYHSIATEFAHLVEIHRDLPEPEAIKTLRKCHLLYAMYPFARASKIFRQTSLPTKLSTYLQCARPIFAHTPHDSSLARLIGDYKLGPICGSMQSAEIESLLATTLDNPPASAMFNKAASVVYGPHNARSMARLLTVFHN